MNYDDPAALTASMSATALVAGIAVATALYGLWEHEAGLAAAGVIVLVLAAIIWNMIEDRLLERLHKDANLPAAK